MSRLEASGLRPARILWASDGLGPTGGDAFAVALAELAPLSIYAAPPRGAAAVTNVSADNGGAALTVVRANPDAPGQAYVSAIARDGAAIASAEAVFAAGERSTEARFDIPPAALARADRFRLTGGQSAGAVFLWDSAARRPRVGLVAAGEAAQPLLSDLHYVRRALEPFALLQEGELGELIEARPDAIVLTDVGRVPDTDAEALRDWVEAGGALIRFAGPRLAAQGDDLTPTPLRRTARSLGGALAWDEPQDIAEFSGTSPFSGLIPPFDGKVRRQVLARPAPDLDTKTWARLEDGSPLVTADRRGRGAVILYHVTASPDWSDLPYSGVFVEMLRRSISAGRGEPVAEEDGLYAPQLTLDGFGRLGTPSDTAAPLQAAEFADAAPSETNPPGLYQGPAGVRAINAAAGYEPRLIQNWPVGATLLGDAESRALPLAGLLIAAALVLLAIDLFIALAAAGRLPALRRAAAGIGLGFAALAVSPFAEAQTPLTFPGDLPSDFRLQERDPALDLRFGYVRTGEADLDALTRAGLVGLSRTLYNRSSVEPVAPDALDLETDPLELYPMIYFAVPADPEPLSATAVARLNQYLRFGGALVIDTRNGSNPATTSSVTGLETLLAGLDAPPLAPAPPDHVLTRSFYLIDDFPGRYSNRRLWIEAPAVTANAERRGDGVSRLFVGDADWAAAWAEDNRGRPLVTVDGGDRQREIAARFGVNLVMYILTGSYKDDQVHLPSLLERLGDDDGAPLIPQDEDPARFEEETN
ncbi:MAG: DUF4159 domain-containing protein [Pseudomonadota bacterium]